jgi:hypothetical protein
MYWLLSIIAALAAAGLSGFIVYRRLSPRIVAAKELDYETEKRNEILRYENADLIVIYYYMKISMKNTQLLLWKKYC